MRGKTKADQKSSSFEQSNTAVANTFRAVFRFILLEAIGVIIWLHPGPMNSS